MSPAFINQFLREPLRKFLLRILILTEKKAEEPVSARKKSLLRKDIHIHPAVIVTFSAVALLIVLLIAVGWSWKSFLGLTALIALTLTLFILYLRRDLPKLVKDDEAMMLLGTLAIVSIFVIGTLKRWPASFYVTPVPAVALLSTLLLHPRVSIILVVILSVVLGIVQNFSFACFALAVFAGAAATAAASRIHTSRDFIGAGAITSGVHFLTLIALTLLHQDSFNHFLWKSTWTIADGFMSAIVALGLLPFLESFFLRVSPLKLLELADFNQPLLKRLMVEAPGTYHHSLMVATISEAAARAIGANPLLCRVGAYYHDIGKLVKPEYFVENQRNTGNPHGNLAPALSSLVVASHIKEGLALAQSAKIPPEIANFIPMHHGTSRIEYFYHQAKEDAQEDFFDSPNPMEVEEESYRYPGPKPETKETAIVMLADSVEATSRTIEDPSHLRFKDVVELIVSKKTRDGQLASSPLTLADLSKIQEGFINALTSIYHARIEYPEDETT